MSDEPLKSIIPNFGGWTNNPNFGGWTDKSVVHPLSATSDAGKSQTPNAKKIPISQRPQTGVDFEFENLRFLWRLNFGVWDFHSARCAFEPSPVQNGFSPESPLPRLAQKNFPGPFALLGLDAEAVFHQPHKRIGVVHPEQAAHTH